MQPSWYEDPRNRMRERSIGVMALIAVLAFVAIAGSIFAYYFVPNPDLLAAQRENDPRARKLVHITVTDIELLVPGNLIARMKRGTLTGVKLLDLEVPWPYDPDAEIPPPEEREDHSDQIFLTFHPTSGETGVSERFKGIYEPYIARAQVNPIAGLQKYVFSTSSPYADIKYYVGKSGEADVYLKCDLTASSLGPKLCGYAYSVSPRVSLHYRFSRKHLPDWRRIDQLVRQLANQMIHKSNTSLSG